MGKKFWIIVIILSLLAALEPLCIDLYLPAFTDIAKSLQTSLGNVQISLSIFLAGFAIGQLFWGPISDAYGRKIPILIALGIFTLSSFLTIYVKTIEQLWLIRFLQAFGGCAGVVVGRAVVNEFFEEKNRTKIFSMLALIMGVAPIIAPSIGNLLLKQWDWYGVFNTMGILGVAMILLVFFFLPESHPKNVRIKEPKPTMKSMVMGYVRVTRNWQFIIYSIIVSMANSALMIYVSNGPFIIMEKGMFSGDTFSIIFAVNAIGILLGSYLVNYFTKYTSLENLTKYTVIAQLIISGLLLLSATFVSSIIPLLALIFLNLITIGILLPATTTLALLPFTKDSGAASAFMGFLQLLFSCIMSAAISHLQNNSLIPVMAGFFICSLISLAFILISSEDSKSLFFYRKIRGYCRVRAVRIFRR